MFQKLKSRIANASLLKILLLALLIRLSVLPIGYHSDQKYLVDWGRKFAEYGDKFYWGSNWQEVWPNQPPGTIYISYISNKLYDLVYSLTWNINIKFKTFPSGIVSWLEISGPYQILKLFYILSDLILGIIIYKLINKISNNPSLGKLGLMLFIFNPSVIYNSSVWGQTDSLVNLFSTLGIYFFLQNNLFFGLLSLILSIYIKPSLLTILPGIIIFILVKYRKGLLKLIIDLCVCILIIAILSFPITPTNKRPLTFLFYIYKDTVFKQQLPVKTANAFNLWGLIYGFNPQHDFIKLGPLTYQNWGLIFGGSIYLVLCLIQIKRKPNSRVLLWSLMLQSFTSFVFFTRMHERYLYPTIVIFSILVPLYIGRLKLFIILSAIHFVNLYHLWWVPMFPLVKYLISDTFFTLGRVMSVFLVLIYISILRSWVQDIHQSSSV